MKSETEDPHGRPGLEAIENHIGNIYREINTKSDIRERFDLSEGLTHVEVCEHPGDQAQDIPAHWHYISYGLSCLDWDGDGKEREDKEPLDDASGFGFELTFRLRRAHDETVCPKWPISVLLAFAEYVHNTGNVLDVGDHIPWNKPLDQEDEELDDPDKTLSDDTESVHVSMVQHILITEDPELMILDTAAGTIQFRQLVGVLEPEIRAAQSWKGCGVLDLISLTPQAGGCYFVTDMARDTSVFDHQPYFIKLVGSEISSVGSNLAHVTALCSWEGVHHPDCTPEVIYDSSGKAIEEVSLDEVILYIDDEAASLLPVAARGRLGHDRFFLFESLSGEVILFIPQGCDEPMVSVSEQEPLKAQGTALQIYCNRDFIYQMTEALSTFSGHYKNNHMAREIHLTYPRVTIVIANLKDCESPEQKSSPPRLPMPVIQQTFSARVPGSFSGSNSAHSLDTEWSEDAVIHSSTTSFTSRNQPDSDQGAADGPVFDFPPPPPDLLEGICFSEEPANLTEAASHTKNNVDGGSPNLGTIHTRSSTSELLSSQQLIHHKPPIPHRTSSLKRRSNEKKESPSPPDAQEMEYLPQKNISDPAPDNELDDDLTCSPKGTPQKKTFHLTESLCKAPVHPVVTTSVGSIANAGTEQETMLTEETLNSDTSGCPPVGLDMNFSYADDSDADEGVQVHKEMATCPEHTASYDQSSSFHESQTIERQEYTNSICATVESDETDLKSMPSSHVSKPVVSPETELSTRKSGMSTETDPWEENRSASFVQRVYQELAAEQSPDASDTVQASAAQADGPSEKSLQARRHERPHGRHTESGKHGELQKTPIKSSGISPSTKPIIPPKPEQYRQSATKHTSPYHQKHISPKSKKYRHNKDKEENNNVVHPQKLSISEKLLTGFSDLGGVGINKLSNIEVQGGEQLKESSLKCPSGTFVYHSAFKPYPTEHFFDAKKRSSKRVQPEVDLNDTFMAIDEMEWDDLPTPSQVNLVDFRPKSTSSAIADMDDSFPKSQISPGYTITTTLSGKDRAAVRDNESLSSRMEQDASKDFETYPRRQPSEQSPACNGREQTFETDTSLAADTSFVILSDMSNTSFDPDLSFIPAPVMRKRKRRSAPVARSGSSVPVDIVRMSSSKSHKEAMLPYDVISSTPVDVGRYLVSSPEKLTVHLQSSSKVKHQNNVGMHTNVTNTTNHSQNSRPKGQEDIVSRQTNSQREQNEQRTLHASKTKQDGQGKRTSTVNKSTSSHPRHSTLMSSSHRSQNVQDVRSPRRTPSQAKADVHRATLRPAENSNSSKTSSNHRVKVDRKTPMKVATGNSPAVLATRSHRDSTKPHTRTTDPQKAVMEKQRYPSKHTAGGDPRMVEELRQRQRMRTSGDARSINSPKHHKEPADNIDSSASVRSSKKHNTSVESKKHNISVESRTSVSSVRSIPPARQTPQMFREQKVKSQHSRQPEAAQDHGRTSSSRLRTEPSANFKHQSGAQQEQRHPQKGKSRHSNQPEAAQDHGGTSSSRLQTEPSANFKRQSGAQQDQRHKGHRQPQRTDVVESRKTSQQVRARDRERTSGSTGEISARTRQDTRQRAQENPCKTPMHLPASFTPQSYMEGHKTDNQQEMDQFKSNTLPRKRETSKSSFKIKNPYKLSSEV